jgi:hypothetical protein
MALTAIIREDLFTILGEGQPRDGEALAVTVAA